MTNGMNDIEGSWDEVMRVIGRAHTMLHNSGTVRIQTDIRVGTRYALPKYGTLYVE